jgi:serine/threonine-protein kinase RsbT
LNAAFPRQVFDISATNPAGLIELRRQLSQTARQLGFGITEQTRLLTASSELARNAMQHGGGGQATVEPLHEAARSGIRLTFEDHGPGIADVDLAMQDGYTSGRGMGLGLPGAKRLVHEFSLTTSVGQGTRIVIVMWKR